MLCHENKGRGWVQESNSIKCHRALQVLTEGERISGLANYTGGQKTLLLESVLWICQLEGHWQLLLNNFRGVMRFG